MIVKNILCAMFKVSAFVETTADKARFKVQGLSVLFDSSVFTLQSAATDPPSPPPTDSGVKEAEQHTVNRREEEPFKGIVCLLMKRR